ncbi:hypothetical protein J5N97_008238 [Dioscorea zingiberensis]|uniref:Uncharacterized protein n=1 Tax=Dioscorea zingiberensis TaxID=325984 RepID=A0A9D5HWT6_9LILI|nr:hypothetical protein J5N97_008238 [Dioscorea zingiberensis]
MNQDLEKHDNKPCPNPIQEVQELLDKYESKSILYVPAENLSQWAERSEANLVLLVKMLADELQSIVEDIKTAVEKAKAAGGSHKARD